MFRPLKRHRYRIGFCLLLVVLLFSVATLGWWLHQRDRIEQQRLALAEVERLQQQMTEPQWNWIDSPVTTEPRTLPWWLGVSGESTVDSVRAISFDLRSYDDGFEEPTEIGNEHLEMLSAFPRLRSLRLPRSKLDDEGLVHLASLEHLEVLDLSGTAITDDGLRHLARLPKLHTLLLDEVPIDGSGLRHLASNTRLADLSLRDVPLKDATFMGVIPSLEKVVITSATLQHCKITDHPSLHSLTLSLAAAEVRLQLARLPRLQTADISLHSEEPLKELSCAELPVLQRLVLRTNARHAADQTRLELSGLPRLEQLTIYANGLAGSFARQLAHLPNVNNLAIYGDESGLDDEALQPLSQLPRLRKLWLHGTSMTDAGVRLLARSNALEELHLESEQISELGIGELAALPQLKTLGISGSGGDVDLGPTMSKFTRLVKLNLGDCRFPSLTLTGETESGVVRFRHLKEFRLTSDTMREIKSEDLPVLNDLTLEPSAATAIHLRSLPALSRLDISLAPDQTVQEFTLERLPQLSWLSLQCGPTGARVPPDIFEHFHTFGRLRNGIIWGLELPDAAREDLRRFSEATGVRF